MRTRSLFAFLAAIAVPLSIVACDDDDDPVAPTTGSVTVNTTTVGDDVDADGYTISIDGSGATAVAATGSATVTGVAAGARSVMLDGVADNCTVATNPASVTVTASATVTADFAISCVAALGSVQVITNTTQTVTSTDVDGYQFTIAPDSVAVAIGEIDTVTVDSVAVGDHVITLSDVEGNCATAADADTATVTVAFGDTVSQTFEVTCDTPVTVGSPDRIGLTTQGVHLWPLVEEDGSDRHSARGVATS